MCILAFLTQAQVSLFYNSAIQLLFAFLPKQPQLPPPLHTTTYIAVPEPMVLYVRNTDIHCHSVSTLLYSPVCDGDGLKGSVLPLAKDVVGGACIYCPLYDHQVYFYISNSSALAHTLCVHYL